jgi:arsenate reductase
MTESRRFNVLFLCTGNSARSVLAEALLNHLGDGRFRAFSAGSTPKGKIHPLALTVLRRENLPVAELRSKSWDEFRLQGAPKLDFVFTLCDSAAAESCPAWLGQPLTAHWGLPDPAAAQGGESLQLQAFSKTLVELRKRIQRFLQVTVDASDRGGLQAQLNNIGHL